MTAIDLQRLTTAVAPHITVLVDRCVGCQECVVRCPTAALTLDVAAMVAVGHDDACVGCRQCERTCPFSAIEVSGPILVAPRTAAGAPLAVEVEGAIGETRPGFGTWAEALAETSRCLSCPDPTCVRGCPAHNDIPAFIDALRREDLETAHATLRRTSVMPDICARVCDQAVQCEGACTWSLAGGQPVAIGALERFVADQAPVPPVSPGRHDAVGLRVAIVGSGPAGLAAAWELVERGADVTVFDKDTEAGGLLRWGIPDFTLAADVAERPVRALEAAGVDFRLGTEITPADVDDLLADRDAVLLAFGAGRPARLRLPGTDLYGVWDATRFLKLGQAALANGETIDGLRPKTHRRARVLVVGAGNTAMDVARTARRLGADAVCIDWMDRRFAAVRPDELLEAQRDGVAIRFNTSLEAIEGEHGWVRRARLSRTHQSRAGRTPRVVARDTESMHVDLVVMAMGYGIDPAMAATCGAVPVAKTAPAFIDRQWLASGLFANPAPDHARRHPVGQLALGRETARLAAGRPRRDGVWVAGDALTGPATVVEAMAQGKEAARGIVAWFASRAAAREP